VISLKNSIFFKLDMFMMYLIWSWCFRKMQQVNLYR